MSNKWKRAPPTVSNTCSITEQRSFLHTYLNPFPPHPFPSHALDTHPSKKCAYITKQIYCIWIIYSYALILVQQYLHQYDTTTNGWGNSYVLWCYLQELDILRQEKINLFHQKRFFKNPITNFAKPFPFGHWHPPISQSIKSKKGDQHCLKVLFWENKSNNIKI